MTVDPGPHRPEGGTAARPRRRGPAAVAPGEPPVATAGAVPTTSIFEQPWWLDAVAPGSWQAAEVRRDGEIVARLPYAVRRRKGLTLIGHPPLTPVFGPYLKPTTAKYVGDLSTRMGLLGELIGQLPKSDLITFTFGPSFDGLLPFHWHAFQHGLACTYQIRDLDDFDRIWSDLHPNCRKNIRKAQSIVAVRDDLSAEQFLELATKTWRRQGRDLPFAREVFERLDAACRQQGAGTVLHAEDGKGRIHTAVYMVWDSRAAYYLAAGSDPELRSSGANSLVTLEAIRRAQQTSAVFDFEGSMNRQIENFFRQFGAHQTPLMKVRRPGRRLVALTAVKDLAEATLGRKLPWFF
jgi:hypothetical protein